MAVCMKDNIELKTAFKAKNNTRLTRTFCLLVCTIVTNTKLEINLTQ
jgi:hypothetical protein